MRLFIGPTGFEMNLQIPGVEVFPPAQQGDIATAVLDGVKTIILIDGLFTQHLSPWHKEILYAIESGVRVIGAASLGALRGVECKAYGMEVYGEIASWYESGICTDDADVAVSHFDASGNFKQCSVPLVNIRATCMALEKSGDIENAEKIIETCSQIFYSNRSWPAIKSLIPEYQAIKLNYIDQKRIDAEFAISNALIPRDGISIRKKSQNALNCLMLSLLKNDTFLNGKRKWQFAFLKDEAFDFWLLTELAMQSGIIATEEQIQVESSKMWQVLGVENSDAAKKWMSDNRVSDMEWNMFSIRKAIRQNARDWFNSVTSGSEICDLALQFHILNGK
jgi:hypothetical protein